MPKSFCKNCTEIIREYLPMPGDYEIETPKEHYDKETDEEKELFPEHDQFPAPALSNQRPPKIKSAPSYEEKMREFGPSLEERIESSKQAKSEIEIYSEETPKEELSDYISETQTEIDPETDPSIHPEYDLGIESNYDPIYETDTELGPERDQEIDLDIDYDMDIDQDQSGPDYDM